MAGKWLYLASPYSHPEASVREQRFRAACDACIALWKQGHLCFSPIMYTHPIALQAPWITHEVYQQFDDRIIGIADELVVLQLPGWEKSVGVRHEVELAAKLGKPVWYLQPEIHQSKGE